VTRFILASVLYFSRI